MVVNATAAVAAKSGDDTLRSLLAVVLREGGSDLHVAAGMPPMMRLDGRLVCLPGACLDFDAAARLCTEPLTLEQRRLFEKACELDFAFDGGDGLRCRGNLLRARDSVGGVFRLVPSAIRSAAELCLPAAVENFADLPRGLVLVTGATGSGKSTTLAALIDKINRESEAHVVTIEDPIEFLYTPQRCLIRQREIQRDTVTFATALRYILRQDPDVVLIGEIRDRETAAAALLIADTGHLVFSTLHSNAAVESIQRLIALFPAEQQTQARHQLAAVLQGIVCQQLVPRRNGKGRAAAFEVLVASGAIRNLVREEKLHQIYSQLQTGRTSLGMQTMAQSLADLCAQGLISEADALGHAATPEDVRGLLSPKPMALSGRPPTAASTARERSSGG
jgi:twitching motility protein PilT